MKKKMTLYVDEDTYYTLAHVAESCFTSATKLSSQLLYIIAHDKEIQRKIFHKEI